MSSSGSDNPGKTWTDGFNDQWNEFTTKPVDFLKSHAMDAMTGGLHKQNEDGSITEGNQMHFWDEVLGAISGRNKARTEGYETKKNIEQAEAKQKQLVLDQQLQAYRTDVAASQAAQGIRNTARSRASAQDAANGSRLGSTGDQYLGGA